MKTILVLLFSSVFISLPASAQLVPSDSSDGQIAFDTVYVITVHDAMPKFRLHYVAHWGDSLKIVVSNMHTGGTLQIIEDDFAVSPDMYTYTNPLRIIDVNYDGYADLMITTATQYMLGWPRYSYWLFQPKTGLFKRDEGLSSLLNDAPKFDLHNRLVKTLHIDYPETFRTENDTYRFLNGSYILIDRLKHDQVLLSDSMKWVWTLEKRIHGKMTIVKKHAGFDPSYDPEWGHY
jgi:hypothetical protein